MTMLGQSQITQVRLPDGRNVAIVDWTDKPLFSTIDLLSGYTDQEIECFTYQVSDNVSSSSNITTRRVATERDTNVATPGGMASTEEILIYNIKVEPFEFQAAEEDEVVIPDANQFAADLPGLPVPQPQTLAILNQYSLLRLEISQKIYAEAGVAYFNTGFGPFIAGQRGIGQGGPNAFANFGLPSAEAPRSFSIPHHIGGQEKYRVVLVNPTGSTVDFRAASGPLADPPEPPSAPVAPRTAVTLRILLEGLYKRPVS
jgi:hypothetical protein